MGKLDDSPPSDELVATLRWKALIVDLQVTECMNVEGGQLTTYPFVGVVALVDAGALEQCEALAGERDAIEQAWVSEFRVVEAERALLQPIAA
jgi:hypothetical protein